MPSNFPEKVQPWFFLLVQISGWAGLIFDVTKQPKDVSIPLALIFAGMVLGARGLQIVANPFNRKEES